MILLNFVSMVIVGVLICVCATGETSMLLQWVYSDQVTGHGYTSAHGSRMKLVHHHTGWSRGSFPPFHFLFQTASCDTFGLVSDALPDTLQHNLGRDFMTRNINFYGSANILTNFTPRPAH